ncbi:MAG: hypothetical protein QXM31_00685 [Candidatus Woesearchaeota archaeon]
MAKKRAKKAKASHAARKPAKVTKAEPHSRLEVFYRHKEFGKAPVEKHFVLQDGRKIESLFQLVDELETMAEDTFRSHVNEWKNDFANWVRDVFESPRLADEMQKVRDRIDTQRAVMKHLLREVAQIASKDHREEVRQQIQQEKKAECKKTGKGIRCVIH